MHTRQMTNTTRATKAQLINLLDQQATITSELEHQVDESKEKTTFALWVAAISFTLGLLF
jgi:hypothetical protein